MASHDNDGTADGRQRVKQFGRNRFGVVDALHMIRYSNDTVGFGNGCNGAGPSGKRGGDDAASHFTQFYAQKFFHPKFGRDFFGRLHFNGFSLQLRLAKKRM